MSTSRRRIAGAVIVGLMMLGALRAAAQPRFAAGASAPPCGLNAETKPRGLVAVIVYKPGKAPDWRAVRNPSISGVALQIHWSDVEPSQGQFDWSGLDSLFAAAESGGKWVQLLIFPGFFTPAWAIEGVRSESFPLQYGPATGTVAPLPLPWDQVYLTRWTSFVKQVGERYGKSPAFRLIAADGPTSVSAETTLPGTPEDLRKWQKDGYTPSKYIEAWQEMLNVFAASFPNQCVSISGGARAGLLLDERGTAGGRAGQGRFGGRAGRGRAGGGEQTNQKEAIVEAATRLLGQRLALQMSDVHAGPGPHVANSEGEDRYILDRIGQVITGFQLRTSAERGSAVMGAEGNPVLALQKSLDYALETGPDGRHVDYVEVYEPDVLADPLQPVLQAAAAKFGRGQ